jgi:hypothetical protein
MSEMSLGHRFVSWGVAHRMGLCKRRETSEFARVAVT